MKPTFLGIGAMKCATSSMYGYLYDHPEIFVPKEKEQNWFIAQPKSQEEYEKCFLSKLEIRGEISPGYDEQLNTISTYYPNIKILYCVRNPIKRFISSLKTFSTTEPHQNYLERIDELIETNDYPVRQGFYKTKILQARDLLFPLHIINFDDLVTNQQKVWNNLCDFLGATHYVTEKHFHYHASSEWYPNLNINLTKKQTNKLNEYYEPSTRFLKEEYGITMEL